MRHSQADKAINKQTALFCKFNKGLSDFEIGTAAFIDGIFVFVSGYSLGSFMTPDEIEAKAAQLLNLGIIKNVKTR